VDIEIPSLPLAAFRNAIAILLLAGLVVVLFVARWDAWVGASMRPTTDDP
jgi:hypothetical protein